MKIPPGVIVRGEMTCLRECEERVIGWRQVGRTTDHPRDALGDGVEDLPGGRSGGQTFSISGKRGDVAIPSLRKLSARDLSDFLGLLGIALSVFCEK